MPPDPRQQYWAKHYAAVADAGTPWLDYSNERVQLESLGLALAASGNLIGQRCLDAGCGRGQLACSLAVFGASEVVAFDMVESLLTQNRQRRPEIRWECVDLNDRPAVERLGAFDRVYAMEVLQYVPFRQTVELLFGRLAPGGRLIGMVPHADCPIVRNSFARFEGQYRGASVAELAEFASATPEIETWACRGLMFTEDQRIAPYEVTPWLQQPSWSAVPNRLLFVAIKQAG